MEKSRRVFLSLKDDDAFWGNGDEADDGGTRHQYHKVENEQEEDDEGEYYFKKPKNKLNDEDVREMQKFGGDDVMGENEIMLKKPANHQFGYGFGNVISNRNGFEKAKMIHEELEIHKLRTISESTDSGKSEESGVSSIYHLSKSDKMYSDGEKSDQKDSGAVSIDSNETYHVGFRNFLRNRPESEIRVFLEGPFEYTDEKFIEEYEKVRKGLETCEQWETLRLLRRSVPVTNDHFVPTSKNSIAVSNFREPDRRLGKYSKYYYHHNVGPEVYSRKVFVGGLPVCVTEAEILSFFSRYGRLQVDWPSKHYAFKSDSDPSMVSFDNSPTPPSSHLALTSPPFGQINPFLNDNSLSQLDLTQSKDKKAQHLGYVFLLFEKERSVRDLVAECFEESEGLFIPLELATENVRVQIRPWLLADAEFLMDFNVPINTKLVAFIGGVPRPLKAVELAHFFEQMYGHVVCVGIDIDNKFKYPRGSGRVAFSNHDAYVQAITDRYIVLDHEDIHKRVEIKPYFFHNQSCEECSGRYHRQHAPYFCPSLECFQYYCEPCWQKMHAHPSRFHHMPVVKGI